MKKLLPFAMALILVGQGCFAPNTPVEPEPTPSDEATLTEDHNSMEGEPSIEMTEGAAVMVDGVAVFAISGKNFAYSPNKITVKKGQKMRIVFTSESGFHDWVVDEFDAHTIRINSGEEAIVEFTPDKAGTFEFYCSVGQHRANGMFGTLVVEEDSVMMEDGDAMEQDGVMIEGEVKL